MSLTGKIKYSYNATSPYYVEDFTGDARALYHRMKNLSTMYPASKIIYFFFNTPTTSITARVNGKRLDWHGTIVAPESIELSSFTGQTKVKNRQYHNTVLIGQTADLQ